MSRTYKDKPRKLRAEPWDRDVLRFEYVGIGLDYYTKELREFNGYTHIDLPTTKTKKRKEVDTEDHWMTTPSWWNNLFHTRPIRGKFRNFCLLARKTSVEELEEMFEPSDSHAPHKYFW